jgi:hypothetical protein
MASHDFSSSLSGRVGVFDKVFSTMHRLSKQVNSAPQRPIGNRIFLMYLFLTQYTSPRSILVAAFHRVGAGS